MTLEQKYRDRLDLLATVLENWEEQKPAKVIKLDMESWFNQEYDKEQEIYTCNTAACALGTACFIPEFVAEGLHPRPVHNSLGMVIYTNPTYRDPKTSKTYSGFSAGREFFGLTPEETADLFDPLEYYPEVTDRIDPIEYTSEVTGRIEPSDVAEKIRKLLIDKE